MRHAAITLIIGEFITTLEEAIDDVGGGGDGEVVVVSKDDKVDEGDEEWVNGVFVEETRHELRLKANLHESEKSS